MPADDAARPVPHLAPGVTVDPSTLEILPAEPHHARGVVELRDALARWMQARGIDQWREGEFAQQHVEQEITRGEWWVMTDPREPERVLASVRVTWEDLPIWGEQPEPAGYIHGVAVDRALRGTGTGTRLIRVAERAIAASGRSISRLDCDESNPVLEPFYAGLGYTPRGAVDFDVPGMDYRVRVLRMERTLRPGGGPVTKHGASAPR
ncbi:GNAT family N-acetyltransferase [Kocuria tytonicola]|uniref:GNAT family N-acetyltransferase n=1 Tax=Kocuria tytonicola TaxID=2055946 RepID=UPI000EF93D5E|nr:GNAT family N-acetyltransferase [Kocuria tytonicola]RLZ03697.1 GNAT family N-acetyltransferase [Kocuria tytonicola]